MIYAMAHLNGNRNQLSAASVMFMAAVTIVTCLIMANGLHAASTHDMNCKTHGTFKFCDKKGADYIKAEGTINPAEAAPKAANLSRAAATEIHASTRSRCDQFNKNKCKQLNSEVGITFLLNIRKQPRFIVQFGAIQQKVKLAICTDVVCGQGKCEQQYATLSLLSWDADSAQPQLIYDKFRVPSCCRCSSHRNVGK